MRSLSCRMAAASRCSSIPAARRARSAAVVTVRFEIRQHADLLERFVGHRVRFVDQHYHPRPSPKRNQGHFERVPRTDSPGQYPVGQGPARGLRIRHPCVTQAEAKRAVRDTEFHRTRTGTQKIRIGVAALAAGVVLGWGTTWSFRPVDQPSRPSPPQPRRARQLNPPLGPRKRRCPLFRAVSVRER